MCVCKIVFKGRKIGQYDTDVQEISFKWLYRQLIYFFKKRSRKIEGYLP